MAGSSLAESYRRVLNQIHDAAERAGREPRDVKLIAVTKGQPAEVIRQAAALGQHQFGENFVQEWQAKARDCADLGIEWHFIGRLQSNKVKQVVGNFSLIHSLDRAVLAAEIDRRALAAGVVQPVLVEVNIGGESAKNGCSPGEVGALLEEISSLQGLRLDGMMVMPPLGANAEAARAYFRQARELLETWRPRLDARHPWRELSMGTSSDFPVAVEEGATMVRVGTLLFGPRPKSVGGRT